MTEEPEARVNAGASAGPPERLKDEGQVEYLKRLQAWVSEEQEALAAQEPKLAERDVAVHRAIGGGHKARLTGLVNPIEARSLNPNY